MKDIHVLSSQKCCYETLTKVDTYYPTKNSDFSVTVDSSKHEYNAGDQDYKVLYVRCGFRIRPYA